MSGHTLFLIAGYPASGKTSLLCTAIQHAMPIFGQGMDAAFRSAIRTRSFDETMSSEDKISAGMWLTLADIEFVKRMKDVPQYIVLHLDLLLLALWMIRPASPHVLHAAALRECFDLFLTHAVFSRYPAVVANTIKPSLDDITRNWIAREKVRPPGTNEFTAMKRDIIVSSPDRARLYEAIYGEWVAAIGRRARASAVSTWSRNVRGAKGAIAPVTIVPAPVAAE